MPVGRRSKLYPCFRGPQVPVAQRNGTGGGYPKEANASIKTYLCPSDPGIRGKNVGTGVVINVYPYYTTFSLYGEYIVNIHNYGAELGRCNYLGVAGVNGRSFNPNDRWKDFYGIYYASPISGPSKTRITDITDGTSHTLAFGEYLGGIEKGTRFLEQSWMGAGCLHTLNGIAKDGFNHFQGAHPGGVNFAFADGSTRTLTRTMDYYTFVQASGIQDGDNRGPLIGD